MSTTRYGAGATPSSAGGRAEERQPRLLLAAEQLRARRRARPRPGRRTRRGSTRRAPRSSPSRASPRRRARRAAAPYSSSTASVRAIASGCESPVAVDALTEAGDRMRRSMVVTRRVGAAPSTSATSRRTELVPMSTAARRRLTPRPLDAVRASSRASAQPPTGSSPPARSHGVVGVQALHARCACPPTPPHGRGPSWSAAIAASRSAA